MKVAPFAIFFYLKQLTNPTYIQGEVTIQDHEYQKQESLGVTSPCDLPTTITLRETDNICNDTREN